MNIDKKKGRVKMLMYIIVFLLVGVLVTFDIMANLPGHRAISGVSVLAAMGVHLHLGFLSHAF